MLEKEIRASEGLFWISIGVIICLISCQLELGSFHQPGPGFVAFLSGLFLSGIGLMMVISKILRRSNRGGLGSSKFRIPMWDRLLYTMGLLLLYILLIEPIGFILSTVLLMFGLLWDFKRKQLWRSLLFSIGIAVASYLIFEVWLRCQLPKGVILWW